MVNADFSLKNLSFQEIKIYSIRDHLDKLTLISEKASKEYQLEKMLDKMMNEWAELNFDLGEWRDTGIPILKGDNVEEIQLILDEHTVKAQTVRANPNISVHEF